MNDDCVAGVVTKRVCVQKPKVPYPCTCHLSPSRGFILYYSLVTVRYGIRSLFYRYTVACNVAYNVFASTIEISNMYPSVRRYVRFSQ